MGDMATKRLSKNDLDGMSARRTIAHLLDRIKALEKTVPTFKQG